MRSKSPFDKSEVLPQSCADRLWRSLKHEDVYLKGFTDGREAKAGIGQRIAFYNSVRPHQALDNRTPMAVWRDAVTGALGDTAVDMTLRLDNARALPTYPQPPQQQEGVAHDNHTNQRLDYAGLLWPLGRWNFDFRCRANQSVAANANRPVRG